MKREIIFSQEQNNAIFNKNRGISKIVGIAGSGKSLVAVRRAIQLALEDRSSKILFLFFNKSLKKEMKENFNLFEEYKEVNDRIKIINIDSFIWGFIKNNKSLKDFAIKNNCEEDFISPFGEIDRRRLLRRIEHSLNYIKNSTFKNENLDFLLEEIDWIRNSMLSNEEYLASERLGRGKKINLDLEKRKEILEILNLYKKRPLETKIFHDYTERLYFFVKNFKDILYERQYQHMIIDEAQDLSKLQFEFIKLICPFNTVENTINFFLDSNQSIYTNKAWIIGEERNFKQIGFEIKEENIFNLPRTYRNVEEIYSAANKLLLDKTLKRNKNLTFRFSDERGLKPFFIKYENEEKEYKDLCKNIDFLIKHYKYEFSDITIITTYPKKLIEKLSKIYPVTKNNEEEGRINITTFESSKGTENKVIFIIGLNKESFPNQYIYPDKNEEEIIEQGKKLLYVAMTRCLEILVLSTYSERTEVFNYFDAKDFIFIRAEEGEEFLTVLNIEIHKTKLLTSSNFNNIETKRYEKINEVKKEEEEIVKRTEKISISIENKEIKEIKNTKDIYKEEIESLEKEFRNKLPLIHKITLDQLVLGDFRYRRLGDLKDNEFMDFSPDSLPYFKAFENELRECYKYIKENNISCKEPLGKTLGQLYLVIKDIKEFQAVYNACEQEKIVLIRNKVAHCDGNQEWKLTANMLKNIRNSISSNILKKLTSSMLKLKENYKLTDERIVGIIREKEGKSEYRKDTKPYFVYILNDGINAVSVNNYEVDKKYTFIGKYVTLGGRKYFDIEKVIKI